MVNPNLRPNGVHHLAIGTRNVKEQIAFFTDVLGAKLKALYWMHGVENTFHAFLELSPSCCIAFQQHENNPDKPIPGVTHAVSPAGNVTAGSMAHLALNVDSLEELVAMRNRIRSRGIQVLGPINHGMCQSIYFAGPENLALEVATGSNINAEEWIDEEVRTLAGISDEELARFKNPAPYVQPPAPVPQPADRPDAPHMLQGFPQQILMAPDEVAWSSLESRTPKEIERQRAAAEGARAGVPIAASATSSSGKASKL
ncbi:lactoylglutathione lyase [Hyaloraphidium curvatum]|nr:lactoylglutathione lyase [Hyaloraphidium curvatum]